MEIFQQTNSEISSDNVEDCFSVPMVVDEDDKPELQLINHSNEGILRLSLDHPSDRHSFQEMDTSFEQATSSTASEFSSAYLCGTIVDGEEESVTDIEKWQPLKKHFEEQNLASQFNWPFQEICKNYLSKNGCVKRHCRFPHTNHVEAPIKTPVFFRTFNQMVITQFGSKWMGTLDTVSPYGHLFIHLNNFEFDHETLDSLFQYINKCKLKPLDTPPGLGELVLAKFNDSYYRARVLEFFHKEVELFLIDFGHLVRNPIHELRALEKRWLHYPPQALECYIYNVQLIKTPENLKEIQKRYANKSYQVEFVTTDEAEQKYWIRLKDVQNNCLDIGKTLIESGLAENIIDEMGKNSGGIIFLPG